MLVEDLAERGPLEELHRDVGDAVRLARVVDGDDVGVVQAAGGTRLLEEARLEARERGPGEREVDRLQRHHAVDDRIPRPVDDTHRPPT